MRYILLFTKMWIHLLTPIINNVLKKMYPRMFFFLQGECVVNICNEWIEELNCFVFDIWLINKFSLINWKVNCKQYFFIYSDDLKSNFGKK